MKLRKIIYFEKYKFESKIKVNTEGHNTELKPLLCPLFLK
jgi:hypothetical protein